MGAIADIFSPTVLEALGAVSNPTEQLRTRLLIFSADVVAPILDVAVYRGALERYLGCALRLGFFEEASGNDLRARLVGTDDELYMSAISECFVAWFLNERLSLPVSPRPIGRRGSVLEMVLTSKDGPIKCRGQGTP